ncbi:MAG TPA: type II toxin-antitoxin system RelE/ParE family toxin [Actinospica sp.]|nr:type II toxin-antitoxin system RelE/ParE family toxin [Actinospica sp.]
MGEFWSIDIEPEVQRWLDTLADREFLVAEHAAERLQESPTTLSEPYSRNLGDGVRELSFTLGHDSAAIRVTYWLAPERRIVLLTVFRKTRRREGSTTVSLLNSTGSPRSTRATAV